MINRRQLFRGNLSKNKQNEIRPPWAKPEQVFIELCSRCGDCIKACPENIIIQGSGKFPKIDFRQGECTFCRQCVDACQDNVFDAKAKPWHIVADIQDNCLSKIGVICQSCVDVCDNRAIKFSLKMGGIPNINLNIDKCSGCGACINICPKNAITMKNS
ncbi:MAG: ferredoxin-type protein NapF [Candidatus Thioglobus sp.]|nr:MAG: ferredoxin-type protein NapF [Candidatus Thioglobus sp.]